MSGKLLAPKNNKTIDWSNLEGKASVHDMDKDEKKKGGRQGEKDMVMAKF